MTIRDRVDTLRQKYRGSLDVLTAELETEQQKMRISRRRARAITRYINSIRDGLDGVRETLKEIDGSSNFVEVTTDNIDTVLFPPEPKPAPEPDPV